METSVNDNILSLIGKTPDLLMSGIAQRVFDRTPQGKIHTISAAGLLHANYRIPSLDYSILLKLTLNSTNIRNTMIHETKDVFHR